MNYLDIAIAAVLILGMIIGARKGLILSILNIVSVILSVIISFTLTPHLANALINYTPISAKISSIVGDRLNSLDSFTMMVIENLKVSGASPKEFLTTSFINIASFIIIFLVVTVIMSFLKQGIRRKVKRSIIGPVDTVLGGVLGFIKWVLILMVVFAFITPIIPLLSGDNQFYTLINESILAKNFINHNIITKLINDFITGNIKSIINL